MEQISAAKWYHMQWPTGLRLAGPWLITWALSTALLTATRLPEVVHSVVAFLPLPPFVWFLWRYIAHIRGLDELRHRIELEALAVAFPLSVALLMLLGQFDLARPGAEGVKITSGSWLLPAVFYLIGRRIAERRYA